jgi:hypothetical protein
VNLVCQRYPKDVLVGLPQLREIGFLSLLPMRLALPFRGIGETVRAGLDNTRREGSFKKRADALSPLLITWPPSFADIRSRGMGMGWVRARGNRERVVCQLVTQTIVRRGHRTGPDVPMTPIPPMPWSLCLAHVRTKEYVAAPHFPRGSSRVRTQPPARVPVSCTRRAATNWRPRP